VWQPRQAAVPVATWAGRHLNWAQPGAVWLPCLVTRGCGFWAELAVITLGCPAPQDQVGLITSLRPAAPHLLCFRMSGGRTGIALKRCSVHSEL
jgi:hypothetical protein